MVDAADGEGGRPVFLPLLLTAGRMQDRRFTNPIAEGEPFDDGSMSPRRSTFETDDTVGAASDDVEVEATTPSPASRLRMGGEVFDSEVQLRVVPESLAHLSDEAKGALRQKANTTRILCDGKVNIQFRGKGPFVPCWVSIDNKGRMTCRDASGACDSAESAGDELRSMSLVGCVIKTPKTARKNYDPAIRVDFAQPDSDGGRKMILHVSPKDARRSGLTLDLLREHVTASSARSDSAARRRGQAVAHLMQQKSVVNPESTIRKRYDILMLLMLSYIAVGVPFRIGFNVNVDFGTLGFFFELGVDAFFITEIFV
eukprot:COSAG02_NODE_6763_length_3375_cov_1.492369_4_plen_314_part_00